MNNLILITCLLQTALAAPQLISFKDGKVGVNFLGYHAEAGLGGGSNGGGLHASAGTPWGQNAAAGLGGNVNGNGRAGGVLYAGAQATPDVGAGAVLGGDTLHGGYMGSEAYANGKVSSHKRTIVTDNTQEANDSTQYPSQPAAENVNAIQKIRPPKKYHSSEKYDFIQKTDDASVPQSQTIQLNKPIGSIVFTKTLNKTASATPHSNAENNKVAPPASKILERQPLYYIDVNTDNSLPHKQPSNNDFTTKPSTSSASFALSSTTSSITPPSLVSLSHSVVNGTNSNGNIAKGVYDDNNNNYNSNSNPTGIIITRERTKLRTHNRKHRRNHQQKRSKANRQRQSSKTIAKVVEQELQLQQQQQQEQQQLQSIADILPRQQHNTGQIIFKQVANH